MTRTNGRPGPATLPPGPLRRLHARVHRGGARTGVQLAGRPARVGRGSLPPPMSARPPTAKHPGAPTLAMPNALWQGSPSCRRLALRRCFPKYLLPNDLLRVWRWPSTLARFDPCQKTGILANGKLARGAPKIAFGARKANNEHLRHDGSSMCAVLLCATATSKAANWVIVQNHARYKTGPIAQRDSAAGQPEGQAKAPRAMPNALPGVAGVCLPGTK
jgi:hypothetical protein